MYQKYTKPVLDFVAATIVLVVTLPLTIVISALIMLEKSGPILFKQYRTGYDGEEFMIYKFRTMVSTNDVRDASCENEYTKSGKYIRYLSLDEIPQFINVIKGNMSLIGPRPWIPEYYQNMTTEQRKRTTVLPGITGLAQVHGRNSLSVHKKISYDLKYVKNMSFFEDLKILHSTIKIIFDKSSREIEKFSIHKELHLLKIQQKQK